MTNKKLDDQAKKVLFEKATEAPFTGKFVNHKASGTYVCANCGSQLFGSDAKFDSNSGWPSFDQALDGAIRLEKDTSHGMIRTEVICAKCGGHLGHVFDDGPQQTTGQRFCINSCSLDFENK
jgi:peptide-methionine (R)-S-oxide reductase